MRNMNKPLPDGGAALPTSETAEVEGFEEGKGEEDKKTKSITLGPHLLPRQHTEDITDAQKYSITF